MNHGRTVHERVATLASVPLQPLLRPLPSHHGLSQCLRYSDRSTSTKEPTPCYQNEINLRGGRGDNCRLASRPQHRRTRRERRGPSAHRRRSHQPEQRLGGSRAAHSRTVHGERKADARMSPPQGQPPGAQQPHITAALAHSVELLPSTQMDRVRLPGAAPNERGRGPRMGRGCGRSRDTQRGATRLTPTQAGGGHQRGSSTPAVPPGLAAVAHRDRAPGSHPGEGGSGPSRGSTSTTKRGGAAACSPVS